MSQQISNKELFDSEKSLFRPLDHKQIQNNSFNQRPALFSQFTINAYNIQLQLQNNSLILTFPTQNPQLESRAYSMTLTHDIKASLFQESNSSSLNNHGFSLFKNQEYKYTFITNDANEAEKWIKELSKTVFLWGFSQNYKATKYIGRGQFGQVWEVQKTSNGKKYAAKIIDKDVCFGQVKGKESLYNEIQILRKLNHPCIVHLECVYESEKSIYIIQQLVEGKLLSQYVKQFIDSSSTTSTFKLQKHHNVKIMKNLLKAVDYLHKMGIAHRDIKPGNIIINSETKMPCIIDFGLSEEINKEEFLFQYCGSPGYMAPELFSAQKIKNITKCDIFSLGSIFYLILAQSPLFDGTSTQEIINMTKQSKKIVNKKIKSSFSGSQSNFLLQLLEYNPQKRLSAQQALNHSYFSEAVYEFLQEIRKPTSEANESSKYSLKEDNVHSKFEELLCDSPLLMENKFNFSNFLNEEQHENSKSTRNMVTTSDHFNEKVKRRVNRYMSEENIDLDVQDQKIDKSTWSGRWHQLKSFQQMLLHGNFWPVKDFISQSQ